LTPGNKPLTEASVVITSFVFHFSTNVSTETEIVNQTAITLLRSFVDDIECTNSRKRRLTVFRFVDHVFGLQVGVDGAGQQMLRTAGLDLHVLVGLQVQLEHVEHVAGVEHVARGLAEIAVRRWSHLDFGRDAGCVGVRHGTRKTNEQKSKRMRETRVG